MQFINVKDLKTNFSAFLKKLKAGEEFFILYRKRIVARLILLPHKKPKIRIGMWDKKCKVIFHKNFKMTEEEFLGL